MAQDDARAWGNRMDSGGEEVLMDALNAWVNKEATPSERNGVDSGNSSSGSLLVAPSGHLRHRTYGEQQDAAKIIENTESAKIAIRKIVNRGGVSTTNDAADAVRNIGKGINMQKSSSSQSYYGDYYEGEYLVDGKLLHLRVSTHPANGARMGNAEADHKVSIVFYKNGEHKSIGEHLGYEEITYDMSKISPLDAANAAIRGIQSLLETGEFVDETGIAEKKVYPYVDEQGEINYSLNRDNASEVADNVLAVTPEMEAEANEATSSQEAQEEMQSLSALEDLQKRYADYRKKISSQREKRLTTFDTKRIFYLKFRISSSAF